MPSEPRSHPAQVEVSALDVSVTHTTIRVAYGVRVTTEAFDGVVGAGETALSDPSGELYNEMFALVQKIEKHINRDLGLQDGDPDAVNQNTEDEL